MSGEHSTPHSRDCGGDAAAYALGALEPREADAFRRHLETCIVCRDELAAFQEVVEALPSTAPQHAVPSGLRRRVLRAVRDEPLLSAPASRRPARWRLRSGSLLARPAWALGMVLVALVVAVGAVTLASGGGSGTRVYQASVGRAELRVTGGHGELIVNSLPAPRSDRIYEVWLQRGRGAPQPTSALFSVTAAGTGDVDVPGDLRGVSLVMVTQEPAGGSRVPTSPPVIVAHLT
jgi:anti-sigma-K factor RskA